MGFSDLASVHKELGNYHKAKILYEQSIHIHKKHLPHDHRRVAWALAQLGNVYIDLQDYKEAKKYLEQSLTLYKNNFSEDHFRVIQNLEYLGRLYLETDDFKTAESYLKRAQSFYENIGPRGQIKRAKVLRNLGQLYMKQHQLKEAEKNLNAAYDIFKKNNHPEAYICLENLAELFLNTATQGLTNVQTQNIKIKAQNYLNLALGIVQAHFSKDSPHLIRIENKLHTLVIP